VQRREERHNKKSKTKARISIEKNSQQPRQSYQSRVASHNEQKNKQQSKTKQAVLETVPNKKQESKVEGKKKTKESFRFNGGVKIFGSVGRQCEKAKGGCGWGGGTLAQGDRSWTKKWERGQ